MTRQEWFDAQSVIVQTKFLSNCIKLNLDSDFFGDWIGNKYPYHAEGLRGAFVWSDSPEGDDYWRDLNSKFMSVETVGA
jgi:hypothetical protein